MSTQLADVLDRRDRAERDEHERQHEVEDDRERGVQEGRAEGDAAAASPSPAAGRSAGRRSAPSSTRRRRRGSRSRRRRARSRARSGRARCPAATFALITRIRFGTSVNVISAVRCVHSEETSRMPTIGSRTLAGRIASANMSRKTRSAVSPKMQTRITTAKVSSGHDQLQPEAGAGVDHLAQLDEREARERDGGVHAGVSVSSKKSASRPAPSDGARWVRTTPAGERGAADGLGVGVDDEGVVVDAAAWSARRCGARSRARAGRSRGRARRCRRAAPRACRRRRSCRCR